MEPMLSRDEVRKAYRKLAPTYDLWSRLAESKARQRCLEVAGIRDGEAVLEVAVGTGILFERVLRLNPHGTNQGVDLTDKMLSHARARAKKSGTRGCGLNVGDAYHLPFRDDSFDLVLNNYMFDLIPENDFGAVLGEFRRVLRSGGRVAIVNMTKGARWFNAAWDGIFRFKPSLLGGCRAIELRPYLESAGFGKIRREFVSQMFFPSEVLHGEKPGSF